MRYNISDQSIIEKIDWCIKEVQKLYKDFDYSSIVFDITRENKELGAYNIVQNKILLNSNIFKDSEEVIKSTILHELAHFIDSQMCIKDGKIDIENDKVFINDKQDKNKILNHSQQWKDIARNISNHTKINIDETGYSIGIDAYKNHLYRYSLTCNTCGEVKQFAEKQPLSKEDLDKFRNKDTQIYCDKCKRYTTMKFQEIK